jgi:hypothetical protein
MAQHDILGEYDRVESIVPRMIILGGVGLVIIIVIIYFTFPCVIPGDRRCVTQRFQDTLSLYLTLDQLPLSQEKPSVNGKVIVVNYPTGDSQGVSVTISPIQWNLPRFMQAQKPEEVGTVVLIQWSQELAKIYHVRTEQGYEQTEIKGFKWRTEVTLVNISRQVKYELKTFYGEEPLEAAYVSPADLNRDEPKTITGKPPFAEISAYIQSFAH